MKKNVIIILGLVLLFSCKQSEPTPTGQTIEKQGQIIKLSCSNCYPFNGQIGIEEKIGVLQNTGEDVFIIANEYKNAVTSSLVETAKTSSGVFVAIDTLKSQNIEVLNNFNTGYYKGLESDNYKPFESWQSVKVYNNTLVIFSHLKQGIKEMDLKVNLVYTKK